jgi:hypothetical protein
MIRIEVSRIYGEFRVRFKPTSPFPAEIIDPSARRFESDLEDKDELRASLECLPAETRELILSVFTTTEDDVEKGRTRLAARLGLTRTALDQRLSRAYKRIRERMKGSTVLQVVLDLSELPAGEYSLSYHHANAAPHRISVFIRK